MADFDLTFQKWFVNFHYENSRKTELKDTINPLQRFVEKRQFLNQKNPWLNNIKWPIYCCFEWHNLFFCAILR